MIRLKTGVPTELDWDILMTRLFIPPDSIETHVNQSTIVYTIIKGRIKEIDVGERNDWTLSLSVHGQSLLVDSKLENEEKKNERLQT